MHAIAILGASGYSGQEVLDRVLRHPELEVVALGSDSLAGRPAGALDVRLNGSLPGFVTNGEALAAGADAVLLDNMSLDDLRRGVEVIGGRAISEASGRVTPETAPGIAETGVDLISVGWLTHSAPILDIGLDYVD